MRVRYPWWAYLPKSAENAESYRTRFDVTAAPAATEFIGEKKIMEANFVAHNNLDEAGNPAGGFVSGIGLSITWQNGPLGRGDDRKMPNGAFVATVIAAVRQRLEFYQTTKFASKENEEAIVALNHALDILRARSARREAAGTEGTHKVD